MFAADTVENPWFLVSLCVSSASLNRTLCSERSSDMRDL
jgi:hypothetical protein